MGDNFNPEIGFVQRDNFRRSFASLRFSPRPKNLRGVRKLTYQGELEYLENGAGTLETRVQVGKAGVEFENSDVIQPGSHARLRVPAAAVRRGPA